MLDEIGGRNPGFTDHGPDGLGSEDHRFRDSRSGDSGFDTSEPGGPGSLELEPLFIGPPPPSEGSARLAAIRDGVVRKDLEDQIVKLVCRKLSFTDLIRFWAVRLAVKNVICPLFIGDENLKDSLTCLESFTVGFDKMSSTGDIEFTFRNHCGYLPRLVSHRMCKAAEKNGIELVEVKEDELWRLTLTVDQFCHFLESDDLGAETHGSNFELIRELAIEYLGKLKQD
jgi:hypothetical protein